MKRAAAPCQRTPVKTYVAGEPLKCRTNEVGNISSLLCWSDIPFLWWLAFSCMLTCGGSETSLPTIAIAAVWPRRVFFGLLPTCSKAKPILETSSSSKWWRHQESKKHRLQQLQIFPQVRVSCLKRNVRYINYIHVSRSLGSSEINLFHSMAILVNCHRASCSTWTRSSLRKFLKGTARICKNMLKWFDCMWRLLG